MKVVLTIVLILTATALCAQNTSISNLDGLTPEGLQPGSPSGSYVLSGLDTVNLYSGSGNITVPLLEIGGRGNAGYTLLATYQTRWEGIGAVSYTHLRAHETP